jgi:hypothetical protein
MTIGEFANILVLDPAVNLPLTGAKFFLIMSMMVAATAIVGRTLLHGWDNLEYIYLEVIYVAYSSMCTVMFVYMFVKYLALGISDVKRRHTCL